MSYTPPKQHWSRAVTDTVVGFIQCFVWYKCVETKGCLKLCEKANIG